MREEITSKMIGIVELYEGVMYYIYIIVIGVTYMMLGMTVRYRREGREMGEKYMRSGERIELIWTVMPGVILILIAVPSIYLIYALDEGMEPEVTIGVIGRQWYWEYEYPEMGEGGGSRREASYVKGEEELRGGERRLLEVDNPLVVPVGRPIRLMITSADVIHSFTIPNIGVKLDGVPGRINSTIIIIMKEGKYYGQCSELCGTAHYAMPIVMEVVGMEGYIEWVSKGE